MRCLQFFLLLFYVCEGKGLDWEVVNKVTYYGQNITLFCKIKNCCKLNSGWDLFNPDRRTLWLDVRNIYVDPQAKYVPFTNKEGFGLTIRNVKKGDFDIKYRCTYGLDEGEPKLLTEGLAFKGPEWIVHRKVVRYGQNLTLFCHIEYCCTEVIAWIVYATKQIEIHKTNNGVLSTKYVVGNIQNGFTLTVLDLTEEDVNIRYSCNYGKRLGNSKMLSEDDAFNDAIVNNAKSALSFGIIMFTAGVLLVVSVIRFWNKRCHTGQFYSRTPYKA